MSKKDIGNTESALIKRTLDNYVDDSISGVSISFDGLPFNSKEADVWIMPRYRITYPSVYEQEIIMNLGIFCTISAVTLSDIDYMTRDKVAPYFKVNKVID